MSYSPSSYNQNFQGSAYANPMAGVVPTYQNPQTYAQPSYNQQSVYSAQNNYAQMNYSKPAPFYQAAQFNSYSSPKPANIQQNYPTIPPYNQQQQQQQQRFGFIPPAEITQMQYIPPPKEKSPFPFDPSLCKQYSMLFGLLQAIDCLVELSTDDSISSEEAGPEIENLTKTFQRVCPACKFSQSQNIKDFITACESDFGFAKTVIFKEASKQASKSSNSKLADALALGSALTDMSDTTFLENIHANDYKIKWLNLKTLLSHLNIYQNNPTIQSIVTKWIQLLNSKSISESLTPEERTGMRSEIEHIKMMTS